MTADLQFTGERYVPGTAGEIAHEHWHRYAFAARWASGRRALDVACGEGYGSGLLSQVATHVTGVDIDAATLAHARQRYANQGNCTFVEGSAAALPIGNSSRRVPPCAGSLLPSRDSSLISRDSSITSAHSSLAFRDSSLTSRDSSLTSRD